MRGSQRAVIEIRCMLYHGPPIHLTSAGCAIAGMHRHEKRAITERGLYRRTLVKKDRREPSGQAVQAEKTECTRHPDRYRRPAGEITGSSGMRLRANSSRRGLANQRAENR